MAFIKKWILKILALFSGSPSNKNNIGDTPGIVQVVNGSNNRVSAISNCNPSEDEKKEAGLLFDAAIGNIKFNVPCVGNSKNPFKVDGIQKLVDYNGSYGLDENDKEEFRSYIHDAAQCNGDRFSVTPGCVQGRLKLLLPILEEYKSKL